MELIKIYNGSLVDARELHEFLEIKTDFPTWVGRNLIPHFKEGMEFSSKLRKTPQKGGRPQKDYYLTLDTAKKMAMMAKTTKGDEARSYFLECEKTIIALRQNKRLEAFLKLEVTKDRLEKNVLNLGGTHSDYIQIDTEGRRVFFNGKLIPDEELPTILLMSRGLATEMTNEILKDSVLSMDEIEELNKLHHQDVRDLLAKDIKKMPEDLPREKNIKKLGE
jgi:phage anti-repressor protein